MAKNKKWSAKGLAFCLALVLAEAAFVFCLGWCYAHSVSGGGDKERAERYEERNASASESVGRIEGGLGEVAGEMHEARREVGESITGIGQLREDGARIAGRSRDIEASAGRIEGGICRIEQIIFEAEEKDIVLADGYDCIDPGGNN